MCVCVCEGGGCTWWGIIWFVSIFGTCYLYHGTSYKKMEMLPAGLALTHWGRVTHICVSKLTIIGSVNCLSPGRRQAIIWTNASILLIGPLGTNFNEILIKIHTFSFKKMHIKMSSAKRRPFCLGLNVLRSWFPSRFNFDRRLGSSAVEVPVKLQRNTTNKNK